MNKKARSLKRMPERGDVLSVSLGNWGFTSCRVVAVKARPVSVLVVGSEYLGAKPPSLDDSSIYNILTLNHHSFENVPLAFWTPMEITPEFEKIGNVDPAEGEDQLAEGKMANWDYIVVHRIMQAQWDGIPRPAAASGTDVLQALEQAKQQSKPLTPTGIIQRFRSLDSPGGLAVADILKALSKAIRGSDSAGKERSRLVTASIEALNRVEQNTECIDSVERDWLMAFFREIGKKHGITDVDELVDSMRDW